MVASALPQVGSSQCLCPESDHVCAFGPSLLVLLVILSTVSASTTSVYVDMPKDLELAIYLVTEKPTTTTV